MIETVTGLLVASVSENTSGRSAASPLCENVAFILFVVNRRSDEDEQQSKDGSQKGDDALLLDKAVPSVAEGEKGKANWSAREEDNGLKSSLLRMRSQGSVGNGSGSPMGDSVTGSDQETGKKSKGGVGMREWSQQHRSLDMGRREIEYEEVTRDLDVNVDFTVYECPGLAPVSHTIGNLRYAYLEVL